MPRGGMLITLPITKGVLATFPCLASIAEKVLALLAPLILTP